MQLNKNYLQENIEYTLNFELIHDIIIDIIHGENMPKIYLENKEITFSGKSVTELVIINKKFTKFTLSASTASLLLKITK
jgi:hypothetical protein